MIACIMTVGGERFGASPGGVLSRHPFEEGEGSASNGTDGHAPDDTDGGPAIVNGLQPTGDVSRSSVSERALSRDENVLTC